MKQLEYYLKFTLFCSIFITWLVLSANAQVSAFDSDKPATSYNSQFSEVFNAAWDNAKFYGQWDAQQPNIFTAADITSGYLKFEWIAKRIICSKKRYVTPYILETDIDYNAGSNRGGVVIRANVNNINDIEYLQEPISDPGFNTEGIAFYPSADGASMIVQFSGIQAGKNTQQSKILIPKPAGVVSMLNRGTLRIEDFGTSVYVYYNNAAFVRIDLGSKTGTIYTSGTVYDSSMQVAGTFAGMEVEAVGKVGVAQRDATLRLYSVTIQYNDLVSQTITFEPIPKKLVSDAPFTVSATATSGLPVEFKLVSGPATLNGTTVTLSGTSGIVTIAANQVGNASYYPANEVLRSFYVGDPSLGNIVPTTQDYVDNWVVTDVLGRKLPSYDEAGPKRADKIVGVFYYVWHGFHGNKVYDISKIIAGYPSDPLSASNPGWGAPGEFHFYGEPETGYMRAEDPWVLRRDLQMLSNAHVDFIYIDATNAITYLETVKKLCEVSMQMRAEGIYTPQIVFTTASSSGATMNQLYDDFYAQTLFDDLWFKWQGKPLILGDFNDPVLRADVKNFFTIKYCWAWTDQTKANYWQWVDTYPQDYGWSTDPKVPEQIPVAVAQHPMSTTGTSYHNGAEPPVNNQYMTDFTGQGLHFAEQWSRALQVDPSVIMVTQWNEWLAQRFIWNSGSGIYAGRPIKDGDSYFVDDLNEEFTRDIAPMKGGRTDNYYYQMISNIRKFKGMAAPQVFSAPKTVTVDGNFGEWSDVTPVFKDPVGDVMHRNFAGYDPTVTYTNTTGRNDIIESRSTYDTNNLYFYMKTAQPLTSSTDPNWMLLFIDADRSKGTGWEGYDFVVNLGVKSTTQTTLKQWDGQNWTNEKLISYFVNGSEMELSIPRSAVTMDKSTPEFYFHWSDNAQQLKDITCFFTDGESAPDRRFNYNFSSSKIVAVPQTPYKTLTIPGTVEFEDFDNGGAGVAYSDATLGNPGGAYRTDESVDIEPKTGGGFDVGWINSNEWLEYTVDVKSIGIFAATIKYAATTADNLAAIYVDNVLKTDSITFPSTGGLQAWSAKSIDIQLTAGTHVLKFFIKNASGSLSLDNMVFTEKNVVYPGTGTGLNKSLWKGVAPGTWFSDSICSQSIAVIDEAWTSTDSPGCGIGNTFWNARYQGEIQALYTETYTFYLTVKDMARLWVNNQLLINKWSGSGLGSTFTVTINLKAGEKVPIRIDFAKKTGDGKLKLEWSSASNPREVVPQYQLYQAIPTGISPDSKMTTISVYPNPSSGQITINTGQNQASGFRIMDLTGRTVFVNNEKFIGKKNIDLSLTKGIYLLKLKGSIKFETQKLIIE